MSKDVHKGKVSRAYVFRCLDCDFSASYEWNILDRFMLLSYAVTWARRDGWSKTKDGWKCKNCRKKAAHMCSKEAR